MTGDGEGLDGDGDEPGGHWRGLHGLGWDQVHR